VTGRVPMAWGSRGLPRSALFEERVGLLQEGAEFNVPLRRPEYDRQRHDLIREDVIEVSRPRRCIERTVEQDVLPGFDYGADQRVSCSGSPRRAGALVVLRNTDAGSHDIVTQEVVAATIARHHTHF
jgi:hypothetical protein